MFERLGSWLRTTRSWTLTHPAAALASAGALFAVTALAIWVALPSAPPLPRARVYTAYTACLLTDGQGVTSPQAAPVWGGMQQASLATHAKVEFQPVPSPATIANTQPYLGSLITRNCDLIIASTPTQTAAIIAQAPQHPANRFVIVGTSPHLPNVTSLTPGPNLPHIITTLLTQSVHRH